ncbi:MAG: glycosyltransferase [Magnetococcales bacterium]|nr:glycosyltransferase [Magnetococcales bacterium]MBF0150602.1 glycosyltransferase [Magnetococcales bacterium]
MEKSVLMVAYHYPPAQASGTHRTLGFSKHLPRFGWHPLILSAHPMAFEQRDSSTLSQTSPDIPVIRAFALDTARHLAIKGRYARILALPDRWSSWLLSAIPAGLWMIHRHRPKVIWSTYPIATSLMIGRILSRWSGLPWIVDLRDPMVIGRHPVDPRIRNLFVTLEKKVVHECDRMVVTTVGLKNLMTQRYPQLPEDKWQVIANGYEDDLFNEPDIAQAMACSASREQRNNKITLLHSGTLYTGHEERNPASFLDALVDLIGLGVIRHPHEVSTSGIDLRVIFRATGHDAEINAMIRTRHLEEMVLLQPTLPYKESLMEMMTVEGLLLFQGAAFDRMIPAKLFEYLRSGRPVFALVGEGGDSRKILDDCGASHCVPLEDRVAIRTGLASFLKAFAAGQILQTPLERVQKYSRREGARALAEVLDQFQTR